MLSGHLTWADVGELSTRCSRRRRCSEGYLGCMAYRKCIIGSLSIYWGVPVKHQDTVLGPKQERLTRLSAFTTGIHPLGGEIDKSK